MPLTRKRGTGITAYEETLSDETFTLAMFDDWNDMLARNDGSFFGAVSEDAYRTCKAILDSTDPSLSDPNGVNQKLMSCVATNELDEKITIWKDRSDAVIGNNTEVRDDWGRIVPGNWKITEILPPRDTPIEQSPKAFAQEIAKLILVAKDSIDKKDADRAARWAFNAGVQWATATLKWRWDQTILANMAVHETRIEGGKKTAHKRRQAADVWRIPGLELAQTMRTRNPKVGQKPIARMISTKVNGAPADPDSIITTIRKWELENKLPKSVR